MSLKHELVSNCQLDVRVNFSCLMKLLEASMCKYLEVKSDLGRFGNGEWQVDKAVLTCGDFHMQNCCWFVVGFSSSLGS